MRHIPVRLSTSVKRPRGSNGPSPLWRVSGAAGPRGQLDLDPPLLKGNLGPLPALWEPRPIRSCESVLQTHTALHSL